MRSRTEMFPEFFTRFVAHVRPACRCQSSSTRSLPSPSHRIHINAMFVSNVLDLSNRNCTIHQQARFKDLNIGLSTGLFPSSSIIFAIVSASLSSSPLLRSVDSSLYRLRLRFSILLSHVPVCIISSLSLSHSFLVSILFGSVFVKVKQLLFLFSSREE